jgi:hypothetical protein
MNDCLEQMWNDTYIRFMVLCRHLSGEFEEKHENVGIICLWLRFELGTSRIQSKKMLTTQR